MKKSIILVFAAFISTVSCVAAFGCSVPNNSGEVLPDNEVVEETTPVETPPEQIVPPAEESTPPAEEPAPPVEEPKPVMAEYFKVTGDSVNIRSGAGTSYSVLGVAEKNNIFIYAGRTGNWIKTTYKHKTAYISAQYCSVFQIEASEKSSVESVILEGGKCLGVPYVYGATRYLDENGNRISSFTATKFDCSSLMQYIFKLGANVNLKLNTRTQIYQGTTIKKSQIKRGDLLFFTNDARKNNTGIERVGHVALYLGDNYILHTSSDYARIEQISEKRWSYYIQAQRIL
ncbi:MAG: C40 family peptidase [Candidatus Coproplasma sp.]